MITPTYTVEPGNYLSQIAVVEYGNANDWPLIWEANRAQIHDPNLIYPGQVFYIPKHARSVPVPIYGDNDSGVDNDPGGTVYVARHSESNLSGTLDCRGLMQLWDANGGNPAKAFTAAEIAMAESSGNEFATGPVGERGYWQINPDHGTLSTYDPNGNAKAAIIISFNGTNWSAWTTYTSGAYIGRC